MFHLPDKRSSTVLKIRENRLSGIGQVPDIPDKQSSTVLHLTLTVGCAIGTANTYHFSPPLVLHL
jgi:hypothetical protein